MATPDPLSPGAAKGGGVNNSLSSSEKNVSVAGAKTQSARAEGAPPASRTFSSCMEDNAFSVSAQSAASFKMAQETTEGAALASPVLRRGRAGGGLSSTVSFFASAAFSPLRSGSCSSTLAPSSGGAPSLASCPSAGGSLCLWNDPTSPSKTFPKAAPAVPPLTLLQQPSPVVAGEEGICLSEKNGREEEREPEAVHTPARGNPKGQGLLPPWLPPLVPCGSAEDFFNKYEEDEGKVVGRGAYGLVKRVRLRVGGRGGCVDSGGGVSLQQQHKSGSAVWGGTPLCVKVVDLVRLRSSGNEGDVQRMRQEMMLMKLLDHPGIVKTFEVYASEEKLWSVMELCTGGTLLQQLRVANSAKRRRQTPPKTRVAPSHSQTNETTPSSARTEALLADGVSTRSRLADLSEAAKARLAKTIFEALCYLHDRRIVHRDIKPDNFVWTSAEPDAQLKLLDFGLASVNLESVALQRQKPGGTGSAEGEADESGASDSLSWLRPPLELTQRLERPTAASGEEGEVCAVEESCFLFTRAGTPLYAAPEIVSGAPSRPYSTKCDVWSAGVLVHLLYTRRPPFSGASDAQVMWAVAHEEIDWGRPIYAPLWKSGFAHVLRGALDKNPQSRWSSRQILSHPYFRGYSLPGASLPLVGEGCLSEDGGLVLTGSEAQALLRAFIRFAASPPLKKVALLVMARLLREEASPNWLRLFKSLDATCTGALRVDILERQLSASLLRQALTQPSPSQQGVEAKTLERESLKKCTEAFVRRVLRDQNAPQAMLSSLGSPSCGLIPYSYFVAACLTSASAIEKYSTKVLETFYFIHRPRASPQRENSVCTATPPPRTPRERGPLRASSGNEKFVAAAQKTPRARDTTAAGRGPSSPSSATAVCRDSSILASIPTLRCSLRGVETFVSDSKETPPGLADLDREASLLLRRARVRSPSAVLQTHEHVQEAAAEAEAEAASSDGLGAEDFLQLLDSGVCAEEQSSSSPTSLPQGAAEASDARFEAVSDWIRQVQILETPLQDAAATPKRRRLGQASAAETGALPSRGVSSCVAASSCPSSPSFASGIPLTRKAAAQSPLRLRCESATATPVLRSAKQPPQRAGAGEAVSVAASPSRLNAAQFEALLRSPFTEGSHKLARAELCAAAEEEEEGWGREREEEDAVEGGQSQFALTCLCQGAAVSGLNKSVNNTSASSSPPLLRGAASAFFGQKALLSLTRLVSPKKCKNPPSSSDKEDASLSSSQKGASAQESAGRDDETQSRIGSPLGSLASSGVGSLFRRPATSGCVLRSSSAGMGENDNDSPLATPRSVCCCGSPVRGVSSSASSRAPSQRSRSSLLSHSSAASPVRAVAPEALRRLVDEAVESSDSRLPPLPPVKPSLPSPPPAATSRRTGGGAGVSSAAGLGAKRGVSAERSLLSRKTENPAAIAARPGSVSGGAAGPEPPQAALLKTGEGEAPAASSSSRRGTNPTTPPTATTSASAAASAARRRNVAAQLAKKPSMATNSRPPAHAGRAPSPPPSSGVKTSQKEQGEGETASVCSGLWAKATAGDGASRRSPSAAGNAISNSNSASRRGACTAGWSVCAAPRESALRRRSSVSVFQKFQPQQESQQAAATSLAVGAGVASAGVSRSGRTRSHSNAPPSLRRETLSQQQSLASSSQQAKRERPFTPVSPKPQPQMARRLQPCTRASSRAADAAAVASGGASVSISTTTTPAVRGGESLPPATTAAAQISAPRARAARSSNSASSSASSAKSKAEAPPSSSAHSR